MSAYQRTWKKDGKVQTAWWVDIKGLKHPDGRVERRIRLPSPVNTRRGAEEYERQVRLELLRGTFGKEHVEVPTVEQFVPQFLTYSENNNKKSTVITKRMVLDRHILPALGKRKLDSLTGADIENFKALMRKKISAIRVRSDKASKYAVNKRKGDGPQPLSLKAINNVLGVLRRLLSLAHEQDVIRSMPKVKFFKVQKPSFDFLDFDEAERLIAAADPEWRTLLLTALKTGLRQGELIGLKWSDIDLVRGKLHVHRTVWRGEEGSPKSGRSRVVELPASVVAALKAHRRPGVDYVFAQANGDKLTPGLMKMPLARALKRSGISRADGLIGWHDLRHTYGSHLAMRGVPLKVIQELMGHATIEMTMRYAHLSSESKAHAVQVLDIVGPHMGHISM